ncbi:MAG: SUMF1/EgtB/PvdO family nonheme iron enzyme [Chloroflexota bacterium]|nr:SUMF1/EgtB/PvdO family nonheme iron enzyme [Chloroflexota bacterium]
MAVLCALACALLTIFSGVVGAQTPVPPSPTPSSVPTPTLTRSPVPTSTHTPSPMPTPTPEPLTLPGTLGDVWQLVQLFPHLGFWATVGLLLLLSLAAFIWKVGGELTGEGAKKTAAWVRKWTRAAWCRLTQRPTPEERIVIKEVCTTCERLELKGFVKEHLIIVSLESIYVPLTARGSRTGGGLGEGMPLLRAAEGAGELPLTGLIARHPRLILVGEAGCGKTTFLKYVALAAGSACAGRGSDGNGWLPYPPPLPLFLPFHGFGLYLADQKVADRASPNPDLLRDYVAHHLRHLDLPQGWIAERLKAGNVLLLLDGLDEVARFEDRRFIAELVTRFATFYDRCRVVVTTRPQGYEGAAQLGGDFERRDINPLEWPDDIRTFLYRWNEEINRRAEGGSLSVQGRQRAHENADSLVTRLETATNVRELANNPLLLTVMAIVHYNISTLPERRADLYNAATELLLGWDKRMGREALAPPPWLDALSATQRRLPLEELAFGFQEQRVLERPRDHVLPFLARYFLAGRKPEAEEAARTRAEEYLAWVTDRTYVLQDIGGIVRFYRKPFQEYLAARRLARQPNLREYVQEVLAEDWQDRWWDEALLLAAGHLITDDPQKANTLLTFVWELPDPPEAPHYNTTLVARALADVPEGLLGSVWEVREGVIEHVARAVAAVEPAFAPQARLEAGLALGTMGDPRRGVRVDLKAGLPDILWVKVPAGPFLMGSTDEETNRWKELTRQLVEEDAYKAEGMTKEELLEILWAWLEGERGQHRLEMPAFLVSRYPVTNAQYACFVEAGGYKDPAWWGGEESDAWAWRQGKPRLEWQRTDRPDFWHNPRFNGPNQPVVGVTWYEVMAYCQWLEEQFRVSSPEFRIWRDSALVTVNPELEKITVRLPTEAEWEKAARGTDGRTWPWGETWDETWANTAEGGLGRSSPVGILPAGDSPCGAADMVGNVWEWTLSLWGPDWRRPAYGYPYRPDDGREDPSPGNGVARVVRGGSRFNCRDLARCAFRYRYDPVNSDGYGGFRCVSHVLRCVPAMPRVARRRCASRVDAGRGLREMARSVPGRRLRKAPGEYRMALPPVVAHG